MKTPVIYVLTLLTLLLSACRQKVDYEKEREAIIKVINKETQAYIDRDFEEMFSTHVHDSLNMRLTAGADNYVFLQGWEAHKKHLISDQTEDELGPNLHITVDKHNYRMKIYPQSAFVVCDQVWTSSYENDTTRIHSIQVRFLEKIEGEWKISFVSFIGTSGYGEQEETEEL